MYLKTKFPVIMYRNFTSLVHNTRTKVFLHHQTIPLRNKTSMVNRPGVKKTEFRRLLSLAVPEKYRLAAAMGLLVISSAVSMSVPFALGKIIDIIYNLDQMKTSDQEAQKLAIKDRLQKVCLGLTGVFVLGGLCNFGRVYLMRISGQNITANLRNNIFSSIAKQETSFFDKNKTGELINRLSADSQLVSLTVTQQVSDGMRSSLMTLAGVGMMFYMSPQLALVGLGIVPPVSLYAIYMGKKVRAVSKELQDSLAASTELAEEKLSNIRTVRAFAMENREIEAYGAKINNVRNISYKEALINAKFYGMTGLSGNLIIVTVLYYGGNLVTTDVLTVGNLASFVLYSAYVGIGLSGVSTFYAEMMKGLGASTRLWELVDKQPTIPISGGIIPSQTPSGHIEFNNVTFAYPTREDVPTLKSLNLSIPPNSVVAVVGGSGSGKSTLGSLLLRLYEPDSGNITLDGTDIRELDPSYLRKYIGTVSQEPVLFSSTIRKNITYGAEDPELVTQEQLEKAALEANAHNFISQFPDGYDTLVGERGVMLSGGQKQRVAIARAILKNPSILLLDEATSALDSQSEHEVKVALDRIMKGRSVITIAHRLSTIRNADIVAVVDDGRIVEVGSYQELLGIEDGRFSRLVKQQIEDAKQN
eukprot:TRINITY_DN18055_c0_g1_i1.p1 TRINITY_DN18055_c0_g1~~TRINITY_DN18055_c0_g1_i1.p1  ORF type:complete len:674 (-),score=163.89 TRINITY_DN18055_c0_g1_i1:131-2065(-)